MDNAAIITNEQRNLLFAIQQYAYLSRFPLNNNIPEGGTLLSALVNLVDTARENPEKFRGLQADREQEIVKFLCVHDPNNAYNLP